MLTSWHLHITYFTYLSRPSWSTCGWHAPPSRRSWSWSRPWPPAPSWTWVLHVDDTEMSVTLCDLVTVYSTSPSVRPTSPQADPVKAPAAPDTLTSTRLRPSATNRPQVSDIQPNSGAATSRPSGELSREAPQLYLHLWVFLLFARYTRKCHLKFWAPF